MKKLLTPTNPRPKRPRASDQIKSKAVSSVRTGGQNNQELPRGRLPIAQLLLVLVRALVLVPLAPPLLLVLHLPFLVKGPCCLMYLRQ